MGGGNRPPKLLRAERADIPDIIRVVMTAEKRNPLHILLSPSDKNVIEDWTTLLNLIIDHPQFLIMKAIDVETSEIAACAIWQFKNYELEDTKSHPQYLAAAGMMLLDDSKDDKPTLGQYVNDSINEFLKSWSKTKFLYVAVLMTDPRFQRRGYGTALMKYGHSRADQDNVPAILVASPIGHPLYLSLGWRELSTGLEIDLRRWIPYADKGDQGWGVYRFYHMLRLPHMAV